MNYILVGSGENLNEQEFPFKEKSKAIEKLKEMISSKDEWNYMYCQLKVFNDLGDHTGSHIFSIRTGELTLLSFIPVRRNVKKGNSNKK